MQIMKPLFISLIAILFTQFSFGQQTVKVWGNCGMCKSTIEKAAKAAGASEADWNKDTKVLTVSGKADMKKIEQAIALVGYDTQNFTAKDEAYFALPECCQYERKASTQKSTAMADCCKNGKCEKGKDGKDCEKCAKCEKCKQGQCADCCKDGKCTSGKDCCK